MSRLPLSGTEPKTPQARVDKTTRSGKKTAISAARWKSRFAVAKPTKTDSRLNCCQNQHRVFASAVHKVAGCDFGPDHTSNTYCSIDAGSFWKIQFKRRGSVKCQTATFPLPSP